MECSYWTIIIAGRICESLSGKKRNNLYNTKNGKLLLLLLSLFVEEKQGELFTGFPAVLIYCTVDKNAFFWNIL